MRIEGFEIGFSLQVSKTASEMRGSKNGYDRHVKGLLLGSVKDCVVLWGSFESGDFLSFSTIASQ